MTDTEIRNDYLAKHGRLMRQEDLSAFKEMMEYYDCADSTSYEDAVERIKASLLMYMPRNYDPAT